MIDLCIREIFVCYLFLVGKLGETRMSFIFLDTKNFCTLYWWKEPVDRVRSLVFVVVSMSKHDLSFQWELPFIEVKNEKEGKE